MSTSPSGVIIYKSRYGTTQQYAEWIRKELRIPLIDPERLDERVLAACDLVVIGTPVYRGKMLMGDWLRENQERLQGTRIFLFIVCTHFADREKHLIMLRENIPVGMLASCEVWFLPGKLMIDRLSEADATYVNLANPWERERAKKEAMLTGDAVREEHVVPLIEAVRTFSQ